MIQKRTIVFVIIILVFGLISAGIIFAGNRENPTGDTYAVNVPELAPSKTIQVTWDVAEAIVKKYRWIYVNASEKDVGEARTEAKKLSNAVGGRPLVLVYLPRFIFGTDRNTYPVRFHNAMNSLISHAMADDKELLISARSYGVHQALRAMRSFDSSKILLTGIAPAFGAFGNVWSDNVEGYISDVENTKCRYCMIASDYDGFTWRRGGAAYRRSNNDTYRGDPNVGKAMERNTANVIIKRLTPAHKDADHTPIDNYINHGLLDAMKACVNNFDMRNTAAGDVVYARKAPEMKIVVDHLAGRNTLPIKEKHQIKFHLENVVIPASVRVFIKGVLVRHDTLAQDTDMTVPLMSRAKAVLVRVKKGKLNTEKTIYLDYDPPEFNKIEVLPDKDRENSFIIAVAGQKDDGYWNVKDYSIYVQLDGKRLPVSKGLTCEIHNVKPGRHDVKVWIKDGAGRSSLKKNTTFIAGAKPPEVSFIVPEKNYSVSKGSNLRIAVRAGDPEGIMHLSVYLDKISEDEFNPSKVCYFPGSFGSGQPVKKICEIPANWNRGGHKLIAVAVDNSGQTTTIKRAFQVK